jgi:hypothetical protein
MICKVCNSRVSKGRNACPNCGSNSILKNPVRSAGSTAALPQLQYQPDSEPDAAALEDAVEPDVIVEVDEIVERTPEVELDEPAEIELNEPAEVELNEPAQIEDTSGQGDADGLEEKDDPPAVVTPAHGTAFGSPDPQALRAMLAEQPELLEPGLTLYTSEKGTPQGAGYTSGVGEIDLLAWDAKGALVVVMVAGAEDGAELFSGVLQRIGWVSKHLSGKAQGVRGIVLLEQANDSIGYAAAAVGDTVVFKTWRVALTFNDVDF